MKKDIRAKFNIGLWLIALAVDFGVAYVFCKVMTPECISVGILNYVFGLLMGLLFSPIYNELREACSEEE